MDRVTLVILISGVAFLMFLLGWLASWFYFRRRDKVTSELIPQGKEEVDWDDNSAAAETG